MRHAKEKTLTPIDALSRAYSLSNPILAGDTESALRVVLESLNEWNVDWLRQKHRTYHKARQNRTPNKIILSRPALLQYIVCSQTKTYEIAQETAFLNGQGSLTERTLILRYVKHLLHESSSRSFYVAIANFRVLHKYDHATTKRFYAVLDQRDQKLLVEGQPDNKTDAEYRRWKMILVDNLEDRFKEFVSVVRGPRNEKRFLPSEQPDAWSQYINECLGLLIPWETEHILPPEFAPTKFNITKLKSEGRRDEWDSAEENRMHTIIDPECCSRLAKACGAPAPEQQVEIPQFKGVEHGPGGGPEDETGAPAELTIAQIKSILIELDMRGTRRRVAVSEYLSIEVDGVERSWLNTSNSKRIRLDLSAESRQIQVFTTDAEGKLLLASLWLSLIDITSDTGWQSSIALEGGQRLGVDIKPVLNDVGELESLAAFISYEECNPLRILTHYFQQIPGVISKQFQLDNLLNQTRLLQGAIYSRRSEFALLMLFVAVALYFILPRPHGPLAAHTGARAERTDKVVESDSAPLPTIPKRLDLAVYENQPTDPPAGSQDREQVLRLSLRRERLAFTDVYPVLADEIIVFPREEKSTPVADTLATTKEIGRAYDGRGNRNIVRFALRFDQLAPFGPQSARDGMASPALGCRDGVINYGNCVNGGPVRSQEMSIAEASRSMKRFQLAGLYYNIGNTPQPEKDSNGLQHSRIDRGPGLPLTEYVKFENVPPDKCASCPRARELRLAADWFNVFNSQNVKPEEKYSINRVSDVNAVGDSPDGLKPRLQLGVKFKF